MFGGDWTDGTMTDFRRRHFQGDVILGRCAGIVAIRSAIATFEEMLAERGISVDPTIYRWVQCYARRWRKRLRWFWRRGFDRAGAWMKPTSRCRGKGPTLYRAVDKAGRHDRFLPVADPQRQRQQKRFLGKGLRGLKHWEKPATLNTDKAPSYGAAITGIEARRKAGPGDGPTGR